MARAQLPVPAGFYVMTDAYRRFVDANGLSETIASVMNRVPANDKALPNGGGFSNADAFADDDPLPGGETMPSDDPISNAATTFSDAETTLRTAFMQAWIPDDVVMALQRAYFSLTSAPHDLGDVDSVPAKLPPVAVRSSATAEDLPHLSFAGQQQTLLHVKGIHALLDAVRQCWASLWTARAIAYRQRMGVDWRSLAMGIVVQVMIPARQSGVLFTANPTTGERGELVINASFGLGEAIVSGEVTPDVYILDKTTLELKEATVGAKDIEVVPSTTLGQGTTVKPVADERRGERAVSDGVLRELAALAVRVEELYDGVPQDIEWAVDDETVWLLQARPITNLPPPPLRDVRWDPPEPGTAWIRRQVVENMPDPLSPLFEELYLAALDRAVDEAYAVLQVPDKVLEMVDRPFFATINGYAYMRADINFRWAQLPSLLRTLASFKRLFDDGIAYWRRDALPRYVATIAQWKGLDPKAATDAELLHGIRALAAADASYWPAASIAVGGAKLSEELLDRFLARWAPSIPWPNGSAESAGVARSEATNGEISHPETANDQRRNAALTSGVFLRGFPSKTLEAQGVLEGIARQVRQSEALRAAVEATHPDQMARELAKTPEGRPILNAVQDYVDRYGHQIYTLDFAEPTQADDLSAVMLNLKVAVTHPDQDSGARLAEVARERDAMTAAALEALGPVRRRVFRRLLQTAQRYAPDREEALFYVGAAWPPLRRLALELGSRLLKSGSLLRADDVFFLRSHELADASRARTDGESRPDLARLARERRDLREARKRLHPPAAVPPDFQWKLGPFDLTHLETQRRNPGEGSTLKGFAVSPGRVTAPASVIRSPADFQHMKPGSILVCPTTTPAWTPLFTQARGLVTDIGGVLAHGSIVAREYGIPAVMGTGNATRRIAHGQTITVDGNRGIVTFATNPEDTERSSLPATREGRSRRSDR